MNYYFLTSICCSKKTSHSPGEIDRNQQRWNPMIGSSISWKKSSTKFDACSFVEFITRWWFQIFFIITPLWGRFQIWLIFFRWVETTNQNNKYTYWRGFFLIINPSHNYGAGFIGFISMSMPQGSAMCLWLSVCVCFPGFKFWTSSFCFFHILPELMDNDFWCMSCNSAQLQHGQRSDWYVIKPSIMGSVMWDLYMWAFGHHCR